MYLVLKEKSVKYFQISGHIFAHLQFGSGNKWEIQSLDKMRYFPLRTFSVHAEKARQDAMDLDFGFSLASKQLSTFDFLIFIFITRKIRLLNWIASQFFIDVKFYNQKSQFQKRKRKQEHLYQSYRKSFCSKSHRRAKLFLKLNVVMLNTA